MLKKISLATIAANIFTNVSFAKQANTIIGKWKLKEDKSQTIIEMYLATDKAYYGKTVDGKKF
jgi:hypothetical protein